MGRARTEAVTVKLQSSRMLGLYPSRDNVSENIEDLGLLLRRPHVELGRGLYHFVKA